LGWADKPRAERALAGFSVAEAIFFPIPPDPLLMALVFAKPKSWWRLAVKTTSASIFGGIIGYFLGRLLFEGFGQWVLDTYHLHDEYSSLGASFRDGTFLAVLAAALTPIPYKLITLSAGAFHVNFGIFMAASAIGRGARFTAVAYLAGHVGRRYKDKIERYVDTVSIAVLLLIIILFLLLR
jgi:membrane protein YqaA with SNARE-associated domain